MKLWYWYGKFVIEQKRKYELIHKAQVKSQYYKELNKDSKDDTPDYVKEVYEACYPRK